MWVESEQDRGSTFHFLVRLERAEGVWMESRHQVENLEELPPPLFSLDILVVEDGVVNQQVAAGLLQRRGHRVTIAPNGTEALAALDKQSFDAVLMDVQMPEMDGLEATAAIRAREKTTGAHVPIIAMTAHAMKGDRERCRAAGMDDYIDKPIQARTLYKAVEGVSRSVPEPAGPPPAEQPPSALWNWSAALRERVGTGSSCSTSCNSFSRNVRSR